MLKRVLSDFETCNYIPASDKDPDSVSFNFLNFIYLIIFRRIANGVTCHCIVAFLHFVRLTLRGGAPCFGGRTISFLVKFESSLLCTLLACIGHLGYFIPHLMNNKADLGFKVLKKLPSKTEKMRKCPKTANFGHVLLYSSNLICFA